uniref:Uncharacterized protein n=1 Tax=Dulem virus 174 TaxID=3145651 RepID=A0AAU8B0U3_9VIRU
MYYYVVRVCGRKRRYVFLDLESAFKFYDYMTSKEPEHEFEVIVERIKFSEGEEDEI